jgi:hypothetical protein
MLTSVSSEKRLIWPRQVGDPRLTHVQSPRGLGLHQPLLLMKLRRAAIICDRRRRLRASTRETEVGEDAAGAFCDRRSNRSFHIDQA